MRVGRYADSVLAWRNVIQFAGPNADRLANLGEALTAQANGIVTDEAKDAFVRSATLDSTTVTSRFYLGVAAEQDGKRTEAMRIFKELIDQAPPNAAWAADVKAALARVDGKPDGAPVVSKQAAAGGQAGPQDHAVQGMVDRLAGRLKQDGSDPDGWVRLVRSYVVLKDESKKTAAIADARKALAGDAEKLAKFETGLKAVESGEEPPAPVGAAAPAPAAAGGEHDQTALITRLSERLQRAGSDPEGWLMLTRSYATLQQPEKTQSAIRDARAALAADQEKLEWFNESLKRFKLD
jgi:cytochrome c-type biogenesis protein CcmH